MIDWLITGGLLPVPTLEVAATPALLLASALESEARMTLETIKSPG
ncbi:MAG: hypothetical protein MUC60_00605 [Oscillatoria sp. Prado101]|jgi:hypothetical protein|nr:hypothetical protein [Oscillatoria sp. Prado101]